MSLHSYFVFLVRSHLPTSYKKEGSRKKNESIKNVKRTFRHSPTQKSKTIECMERFQCNTIKLFRESFIFMQLSHVFPFRSACLQLHNLLQQRRFRRMCWPLFLWLKAFDFNEKIELHEIEEFQMSCPECVETTRCGKKCPQSIV